MKALINTQKLLVIALLFSINTIAQKADTNKEWYDAAIANIEKSTLDFYPASNGGFRAANMQSHSGFIIKGNSFTAQHLKNGTDSNWRAEFSLLSNEKNSSTAKSASYLKYAFQNYSIEYINRASGMEQNFIINKKQSGSNNLSIKIKISTDLKASMVSSSAIAFSDNKGVKLMYDGLQVFDANHNTLASSMNFDSAANILTISANDKNAVYPVTIDPITHSPEWSTSADGLLSSLLSSTSINSALYGYTVTGLGDVNGDGFGDVAVSAPALADVFSGTGELASVGAVFVFYGSINGLSTTPAKTLQPSTAIAGALFGMSVDAGDVTGDGINDIVVGAPLDQVSINVSLLTLNGNVGKVYVFPGGNSAATNPTNFVTLQLNTTYLSALNIVVNPLFGFSVAVTEDLNNDGKQDIVVGSPLYTGISLPLVKSGAAFTFLSDKTDNNFSTVQKITSPNATSLLFGYSVDGLGDFNGDGINDIVVGSPASLTLTGSAFVFYGNHAGVKTNTNIALTASSNPLGNIANLFGFKVKGTRDINGVRNGNVLVGAPLGGTITNLLSLTVQSGSVSLFKKNASASATNTPDQTIETPRSSSILSVLNTMNLNVLFGAAIDNVFDINCDGYPDIVIGEPLSSGTNITQLQAAALGGAAYIYYGTPAGTYKTTPSYTVSATYGSDIASINGTALFGFSVAGAKNIKGSGSAPRVFVGSPSGALDFNSLLNLGSTLGTLFNFAAGNNGPGKAYGFDLGICSLIPSTLPVTLISFNGTANTESNIVLNWATTNEVNMNSYQLEKSIDGKTFTTIAVVLSAEGNENNYSYTDNNSNSTVYYRLKMVDRDGKFTYSNVVVFNFNASAKASVDVYPNPVRTSINVRFSGMTTGEYYVKIYNVAGQQQVNYHASITGTEQSISIERTANMSTGIYFAVIIDANGNKVSTTKIAVE